MTDVRRSLWNAVIVEIWMYTYFGVMPAIQIAQKLLDKLDKCDILNIYEKKPCEIAVLLSRGFLENNG